eukprot:617285_1
MSAQLSPHKNKNRTPSIPGSNDTLSPRSHLTTTSLHGYHTFDEYDSQHMLNQCVVKHPNQSWYSMYSMEHMQRMSELSRANGRISARSRVYSCCGTIYRKCCFTASGMKLILSTNILLVLLNIYLIIYEAILLSTSKGYLDTSLPLSFFICDVLITVVLSLEVLLHWHIGYMCNCYQYLCKSTMDNKIDAVVMVLSVLCCILYSTDFDNSEDMDNFLFLGIRITRDVIRIIRCYFFFRLLHENLAFDYDQNATAFHVQVPLKTKSVGSNLMWDTFMHHREVQPQCSMYKVPSVTMFKVPSTTFTQPVGIPEHQPYHDFEDINSDHDDIQNQTIDIDDADKSLSATDCEVFN